MAVQRCAAYHFLKIVKYTANITRIKGADWDLHKPLDSFVVAFSVQDLLWRDERRHQIRLVHLHWF